MTASIFISYRRSDSKAEAWQIHQSLSVVFGPDEVFLDLADNTMGDDYATTQINAARSAAVTLVIIGKGWLDACDASGRRRLDNEGDPVRREVEAALHSPKVVTMPVFLVSGTNVTEDRLPFSMRDLARKHGPHIRFGPDFDQDMAALIDALKNYVTPQCPPITRSIDLRDDLKNVIIDHRTSAELLRGTPPSLLQCIETTRTCYLPFADKSRPVAKDFLYNHYWGPSVIFYAAPASSLSPTLLWYHRVARPGEPVNVMRRGPSILLHASFVFNVTREVSPMDRWVAQTTREGASALGGFVRVPDGVLFKLLDYKIALFGLVGECRPFAVITRDLRATEHRVYTQYVFVAIVRVVENASDDHASEILSRLAMQNDGQMQIAPSDLAPEFFLQKGPTRKVLDYIALRGLLGNEDSFEGEGGRFARGFEIV